VKTLFDLDINISTNGTDGEPGTGLGLLLCKDFVELHAGTISVASKPDKGSTFVFSLPRTQAVARPPAN